MSTLLDHKRTIIKKRGVMLPIKGSLVLTN